MLVYCFLFSEVVSLKSPFKASFIHIDRVTIFILLFCIFSGIAGAIIISGLKPRETLLGFSLSLGLIICLLIVLGISIQWLLINTSSRAAGFYENLSMLVHMLPYRAVVLNRRGQYIKIFKAFNDPDASQPDATQGRFLQEFCDKDLADYCLQMIKKTIEENATQVIEYTYPLEDRLRYIEGHLAPFKDPQSNETYVLWISRDITERKQNEQTLINGERRIRSIASALPDRTVILTPEGLYHDVLKIDYDTTPIGSTYQPQGKRLEEIFDKDFADFCLAKVQETVEKGTLQLFEYPYIENGKTFYLEGRTVPYTDIITGEQRVIWISRNITERKHQEQALRESQQLLHAIIGVFPDRTLIFDMDGRYHEILNPYYNTLDAPQQIKKITIGGFLRDYFSADFAEYCLQKIRQTIESGTIQVFEYDSPLPDEDYKFEGRTIPFIDPVSREPRVLWVSRDISLRKKAEQQQLELSMEKEKLEFFKDFVNNMTHDLKTPLTVIETSLYLSQRLKDPAEQSIRLETARGQVQVLNQMVDDMLSIARYDKIPSFELELIELSNFLETIVNNIRPKAEHKQQALQFGYDYEPITVKANPKELGRAISNLIDNAIKYTPEKGKIGVLVKREKFNVIIRIQDSGIGIDPQALPHIFERFYRSENGRFTAAGAGLGLAITQHIIKLHEGEIDVESEVNQGSTFSVKLPIYESA